MVYRSMLMPIGGVFVSRDYEGTEHQHVELFLQDVDGKNELDLF